MGACVVYPGLWSHPQHELYQQLANEGYGALAAAAVPAAAAAAPFCCSPCFVVCSCL